jgi:magnesium-transporting ATPase (P-type)
VSEGSGKICVLAVGDNSEWGKTISLVTHSGDEQTPLQEKLTHVAATVGKIGASVAATCFIALLVRPELLLLATIVLQQPVWWLVLQQRTNMRVELSRTSGHWQC